MINKIPHCQNNSTLSEQFQTLISNRTKRQNDFSSLNNGCDQLVCWTQTSPLSEMMRSCKSFPYQGRIQDFKLGGALKKLRQAEGGAEMLGVFRVKNHDFTPKNLIFSNFRGGRAPGAPSPPLDPPLHM
jgi:hypothetical protein